MIKNETIILFEVKSAFMGLEYRYSDSTEVFKTEFDKRYIYSKRKHQQINQLLFIDANFNEFLNRCQIPSDINYNVLSCLVVFDEALSLPYFNKYIGGEFNKEISTNLQLFKNIKPSNYNSLITFNELYSLKLRVKVKTKRFLIFENFFAYEFSFEMFLDDIKKGELEINGIDKVDIM